MCKSNFFMLKSVYDITQEESCMDGIGWQEQNELYEFVNNIDMISEDYYT